MLAASLDANPSSTGLACRRSLNSTEVIQAPKKAPTKQDVVVLIKELYDLGTNNDAEDKYLEFRIRLSSAYT